MPMKGQKRDASAVRDILVNASPLSVRHGRAVVNCRIIGFKEWRRAVDILTDMDARTGRRDPSKRKNAKR